MRKLLFSTFLLFAVCIAAFAALTSLPAPIIVPWAGPFSTVMGSTYFVIDGDTDELAYVVQIPKTGMLTQLAFATGTITTGDTGVLVSLDQLNTDANPSGAFGSLLYKANSNGTVAIADSDDNVVKAVDINGGTGVSCTLGDIVAVRIKRPASTGTLVGQFKVMQVPSEVLPEVQDYNITAGTAWTKTAWNPQLVFNIGGWIAPIGCIGGGSITISSESFASPAQKGLLVNYPVSVRAIGVAVQVIFPANSSVTFNLYSDPTGTPVQRAITPAIDTDLSTSVSAGRNMRSYFATPYTLAANTNYVLAMSPQDATSLYLQYLTVVATYAASNPTGPNGVMYSRADSSGGAFTATTTKIPIMGLIIDQVDTGGTSAPNFIAGFDKINPRLAVVGEKRTRQSHEQ